MDVQSYGDVGTRAIPDGKIPLVCSGGQGLFRNVPLWWLTHCRDSWAVVIPPQNYEPRSLFYSWDRYNSCFCWSSYFSRSSEVYVEFRNEKRLGELAKTCWPILLATGLGAQVAVMWLMTYRGGRGGGNNDQAVNLLYRSESERQIHFEVPSQQERGILRRRPGPIQRTLQSIPCVRRIFGTEGSLW